MKTSKRKLIVRAVVVVAVIAAGVHFMRGGSEKGGAGGPQAIPVVVQTATLKPAQVWTEFSGRLQPVNSAQIRPEVSGRITRVLFQDGKQVKAGDTLFVIEPGPYEAAVASAEAELASARANANFATVEQRRAASMVKTQAIAKRVFDERSNANQVATASVKAAQAKLKQARIDLDHAYVKAPISGRAGRVELTVGNVVQAGPGAPLLTSIVSNDNIYADFEVDEQTYLQSIRSGASDRSHERAIPVQLHLQGEADRTYDGTIYSFDNALDVNSGTIRARARFANKDGALLPGMFVTVRLAGSAEREAIAVPERAIGFDQSKKYVYVVDGENTVVYREITLGDKLGDARIVLSGLQAGDKVIVDGIMHVRPGAVVAATEEGETPAKTAEEPQPNDAPKS